MKHLLIICILLLGAPLKSLADAPLDQVEKLQSQWAKIHYQLDKDQQEAAFEQLADLADQAVKRYPDSAELWIWRGIILSTYAGAKGGLGALSLVQQARESLEHSLQLDNQALAGSAYTSLGALYYQVPGWPLSFGSDKKARHYLEQALAMNPDGIDPNYFYGDFLIDQKEYLQARSVLEQALQAPLRPGREVADAGRRLEIQHLLSVLDARH